MTPSVSVSVSSGSITESRPGTLAFPVILLFGLSALSVCGRRRDMEDKNQSFIDYNQLAQLHFGWIRPQMVLSNTRCEFCCACIKVKRKQAIEPVPHGEGIVCLRGRTRKPSIAGKIEHETHQWHAATGRILSSCISERHWCGPCSSYMAWCPPLMNCTEAHLATLQVKLKLTPGGLITISQSLLLYPTFFSHIQVLQLGSRNYTYNEKIKIRQTFII